MTQNYPQLEIRPFRLTDQGDVIELWRRCGLLRPQNDPQKDIARKMKVRPDLFLVAVVDGCIVGSAMCGYEGHRGSVNYFGVDPEYQRRGIGWALLQEAERLLLAEGCPKINLHVRNGNEAAIEFYKSVGFVLDEVISMGKRLEKD